MKKIVIFLLFSFFVFSLSACSLIEKTTEVIEGEDIPTSEISELTGIWTAVANSNYKGFNVESGTYQFKEDGTCAFALVLEDDSGWTFKGEGNCYLNNSKNKIRIETETNKEKNWDSFSMNGNEIIIEGVSYNKVVK